MLSFKVIPRATLFIQKCSHCSKHFWNCLLSQFMGQKNKILLYSPSSTFLGSLLISTHLPLAGFIQPNSKPLPLILSNRPSAVHACSAGTVCASSLHGTTYQAVSLRRDGLLKFFEQFSTPAVDLQEAEPRPQVCVVSFSRCNY